MEKVPIEPNIKSEMSLGIPVQFQSKIMQIMPILQYIPTPFQTWYNVSNSDNRILIVDLGEK